MKIKIRLFLNISLLSSPFLYLFARDYSQIDLLPVEDLTTDEINALEYWFVFNNFKNIFEIIGSLSLIAIFFIYGSYLINTVNAFDVEAKHRILIGVRLFFTALLISSLGAISVIPFNLLYAVFNNRHFIVFTRDFSGMAFQKSYLIYILVILLINLIFSKFNPFFKLLLDKEYHN